jgi:hypothetical protein
VVRHDNGPVETHAFLEGVAIENCRSYLDNTYWGRIPKILGKVGDSLMIWKS